MSEQQDNERSSQTADWSQNALNKSNLCYYEIHLCLEVRVACTEITSGTTVLYKGACVHAS